ncbi:MAG TPA: heme o synthase [Candidatus Saccharimonadales bacterium]|nr:heme o synthase [Candidatus Saccharimonadales bacterium]
MLKTYYELTKPGIIRGNLMTAAAGFFLGSMGNIDFGRLLAALGGISLLIASACVFNNYIDRRIDKLMKRTKKRALAAGQVSVRSAMVYAVFLGLSGFILLALFTNLLTVALGLIAMFFYVVVYGYVKRRSEHGTLVGTIPGALPPVAGYTAVTNEIDMAASLLFLALVCWQMPHFYAISIFRMKEYETAKIPVLPLKKGVSETKKQMLAYMLAFGVIATLFAAYGFAGYIYLIAIIFVSLRWLQIMFRGFEATDDAIWARSVFGFSLMVLTVFSAALSLDSLLR